jgi:glycosyltransferase involved in cell wall biosynthesis
VRRMHVVFAHDHQFLYDTGGDVYTSGKLPYAVWRRYLDVFGSLTVFGRGVPVAEGERARLSLSSGPSVRFELVPSLSGPVNAVRNRRRVRERLRAALKDADALVARLPSEVGLLAVEVARELGTPWAVEVVGCPWDALWNYGSAAGRVYAPVLWARTRAAVARAPYALYVTRDFLQRRYPSPGRVEHCSNVELPDVDAGVLARRVAALRDRRGPLVLGTNASLGTRYKGLQTVLQALQRVGPDLPPYEFRVLGAGDPAPWRRMADDLGVGERVVFSGTLPGGAAVAEWLDAVHLYLQPSLQEGLPRSLVEAMSRGCPCVGSTAGGIPELLPPAVLHAPGDHRALGRLIVSLATDPEAQAARAAENMATARLYTKALLDERRGQFWRDFADSTRAGRHPDGG